MENINNFITKMNTLIKLTLKSTESVALMDYESLERIKELDKELGINWIEKNMEENFKNSTDYKYVLK